MTSNLRWGMLCILPCYLLDQLTKWLVRQNLDIGQGMTIIEGYFDLVHVRNTGAAFGILRGIPEVYRTWFFFVITLVACGAIFLIFRQAKDDSWLLKLVLALVFAGALGNLTDRLLFAEVVDFLNLHVHAYHWPTFNVADIYISLGMVGLVYYTFFGAREH